MHRRTGLNHEQPVVGVADVNKSTDRPLSSILSSGVSAAADTVVSNIADASKHSRMGQLGKMADDDDETHPGLEKPFGKQEELRL